MFLALLRGLVAQRLPIFFREHLLTVVTVLVLAALPARIFPQKTASSARTEQLSADLENTGASLSFRSHSLSPEKSRRGAAPGAASNGFCWRKRGATISAAI